MSVTGGRICSDCDSSCLLVANKLSCYRYDPCKGLCPFLFFDWILGAHVEIESCGD